MVEFTNLPQILNLKKLEPFPVGIARCVRHELTSRLFRTGVIRAIYEGKEHLIICNDPQLMIEHLEEVESRYLIKPIGIEKMLEVERKNERIDDLELRKVYLLTREQFPKSKDYSLSNSENLTIFQEPFFVYLFGNEVRLRKFIRKMIMRERFFHNGTLKINLKDNLEYNNQFGILGINTRSYSKGYNLTLTEYQ